MKYLLLIGVVVLAFWFLTRKPSRDAVKPSPSELPPAPADETMVRCARCGVFLPRTEALREGDASYCSEQHRQLGNTPEV